MERLLEKEIPSLIIPPELQAKRDADREAELESEWMARLEGGAQTPPAINEEEKRYQIEYLRDKPLGKSSIYSYIKPEDEQEARETICKSMGFPPPRVFSYYLLVAIYIRPTFARGADGKLTNILIPDKSVAMDQYRKNVGLVLDMGSECWKHPKFKDTGPLCRIGDWIIIPRHEGVQFKYRGIPMQYIPDDRALGAVSDPSYVEEA